MVDFSHAELEKESELNAKAQNEENAEQKMAFEMYYRMGGSRSAVKVAQQIGKTDRTIENWISKYRWQQRIKEREKIAAEHSLTVQKIVEEEDLKRKHVNLYDAAINKAVKEIVDGKVKIKSINDLIQLIDARWKLAHAMTPSEGQNPGNMNFYGPTQVDLGLEKMNRNEKLKFIQQMLAALQTVNTGPSLEDIANSTPEGDNRPEVIEVSQEVIEAAAMDVDDEEFDLDDDISLEI